MRKVKVSPADLSESDENDGIFGFIKNFRKIENEALTWLTLIEKEIVDNRYKDTSCIVYKDKPQRILVKMQVEPYASDLKDDTSYLIIGTSVVRERNNHVRIKKNQLDGVFKFNRKTPPSPLKKSTQTTSSSPILLSSSSKDDTVQTVKTADNRIDSDHLKINDLTTGENRIDEIQVNDKNTDNPTRLLHEGPISFPRSSFTDESLNLHLQPKRVRKSRRFCKIT